MWKRYVWLAFWIAGVLLAIVRLVHHLQTDAPAWRLAVDGLMIVLFGSNCTSAWRKLKSAKTGAHEPLKKF